MSSPCWQNPFQKTCFLTLCPDVSLKPNYQQKNVSFPYKKGAVDVPSLPFDSGSLKGTAGPNLNTAARRACGWGFCPSVPLGPGFLQHLLMLTCVLLVVRVSKVGPVGKEKFKKRVNEKRKESWDETQG